MSADISSCTSRSTYRPSLDRYVDWHIGRHSANMSTNRSVDCRAICRPIGRWTVGQYVDQYVGRGVHKIHMIREILMFFLQNIHLEKFSCFSCTVWSSLCFWSSMYLMINSFWKQGCLRLGYIWMWSMLNMKSAGHKQSLLPLPDFSRQIEGDSARRVFQLLTVIKTVCTFCEFEISHYWSLRPTFPNTGLLTGDMPDVMQHTNFQPSRFSTCQVFW